MSDRTSNGSPEDVPGGDLTRRNALKLLGLAPAVAAMGFTAPQMERVSRALARIEAAGAVPGAPKFFTAYEWRTVKMLADYIIPRDERSGSATDAKVPEYMDFLLADKDTSESNKTAIRGGLAWLDEEARHRFDKTFHGSTDAQRRQILDDIAYPKKAPANLSNGVAFFNRFRDLVAGGFFSSEMGWRDVQYIGNVFNPDWTGCPPEANAKLGVTPDVMNTRVAPH
jgi:gluconate 2-dehydrogenase gamma chain